MSEAQPAFLSHDLQDGEEVIAFVPEPDRDTRLRILRALLPLFLVLVFGVAIAFNDDKRSAFDALGMLVTIAALIWLFIHGLRLCRTSYTLTSKRLLRFVAGHKIEELEFASCAEPFILDLGKSDSLIARWSARFMSLRPMVRINRREAAPPTLWEFLSGRDMTGMQIGYPGHDIPTSKILNDATRAWEAAQ